MNEDLRKRFRFFHENAGGVVGEAAIGALALARAELRLEELQDAGEDVAAWWEDDIDRLDISDLTGEDLSPDEVRAKFASNEWTGPYGCVVRIGETTASLWGIVLGQWGPYDRYASRFDPYARVVVAELASEALAEVDKEAAERARAARMDVATLAH